MGSYSAHGFVSGIPAMTSVGEKDINPKFDFESVAAYNISLQ